MGKDCAPLAVKHKDVLALLNTLSPSKKVIFLQGAPSSIIKLLSEVFKNLLKSNISVPPCKIKKLKRNKDLIRKVALKKTPIHAKKQLLCSRRGAGILSTVIPLALSAIKSIFGL